MDRAIGSLHTVAAMVRISSTLRVFVITILVPMRTEHDKRKMTRNINVKTCIKGHLLVSVMTSCVGCILGKAIAIKVR
jgi:uncharacterized Zn finger protein